MGIEHSEPKEVSETCRCPVCGHVSTLKVEDGCKFVGLSAGPTGDYFACQNPKCNVERIYGTNAVMVSGR